MSLLVIFKKLVLLVALNWLIIWADRVVILLLIIYRNVSNNA